MNSLPKSVPADPDQPLFADAGITTDPQRPADAPSAEDQFAAFFDLMAVVEELCPVWPPREPFRDGGIWLL